MRISVLSDEISQDLTVAADVAVAGGIDGLEIRSVDGTPPHRLSDAALTDIRSYLGERGLLVSAFCPPGLKCPPPTTAAERAAVTAVVQRAVEQAALLGTGLVRIFSFYRTDPITPRPERAAEIARGVLDPVQLPEGVRLAVETGTRSNTPTIRLALRFLDALAGDALDLLWDPGNTVFSGFDPAPFPGDFALAPQRIAHVHVKDPQGTTRYVRLGDGDLPWPAILAGLDAAGYDGWLTLETHWRHDRELTPQERDEPHGEGISRGGVEASKECIAVLQRWLDSVHRSRP
jgi:sugar phosphate isomerase/epimerase